MHKKIRALFDGDRLRARALRGVLSSVSLEIGSHMLRFGSNIVLTRLLFPEAFGLMALVQTVLTGAQMVSQFGLRAAIIRSDRGDDEAFLQTAWTMQVIRNLLLWLVIWLCTPLVAGLYGQPQLEQLLPVAAISLIITGFHSINVLRVQRHMQLGRYSLLNLLSLATGLVLTAVLAWWFGTVWALAWGLIGQAVIGLLAYHFFLPGVRPWLRLERAAALEILGFGKFLFISGAASYVIKQSDRAVLGLFIPVDLLGIYALALAIATLPTLLAIKVAQSVVFPLYRFRHPMDGIDNQAKIFRTRRMATAGTLGISGLLAWLGPSLVVLLYDPRYEPAGAITILLCMGMIPQIIMAGAMNAALIKGDSFRFMIANLANAVSQGTLLYVLVKQLGVPGAALAMGVAPILTYPLVACYLSRYRSWDFLGDILLMGAGFAVTGSAYWYYWDEITRLFP